MSRSAAKTLAVAEKVTETLARRGIGSALIGALALSEYHYARATLDVDLATAVNPFRELSPVVEDLESQRLRAELVLPDAEDPLGGVINVRGKGHQLVQAVNFLNPLRSRDASLLVRAAIEEARPVRGTTLRVVPLQHLIALKLYAGGPKSASDITEVLKRNPGIELARVRELCERHGLPDAAAAVESFELNR